MSYNEMTRRALERQGWMEWMSPKVVEAERARYEEYLRNKEKVQENTDFPQTRSHQNFIDTPAESKNEINRNIIN